MCARFVAKATLKFHGIIRVQLSFIYRTLNEMKIYFSKQSVTNHAEIDIVSCCFNGASSVRGIPQIYGVYMHGVYPVNLFAIY